MRHRAALVTALALTVVAQAAGYYLPGTYPQEFFIGQQIQGQTGPAKSPAVHLLLLTVYSSDAAEKEQAYILLRNSKH